MIVVELLVRIWSIVMLLAYFLYEVTLSSIKVLWWIYTKPQKLKSEFYEMPIHSQGVWQHIVVAHFITLTPGTLAVEIDHDRPSILIHFLEAKERDSTIKLIRDKIEPLVIRIFSPLWGDSPAKGSK